MCSKMKDFDVQQSKQNIVEAPNKSNVTKQTINIDKEKQNEVRMHSSHTHN